MIENHPDETETRTSMGLPFDLNTWTNFLHDFLLYRYFFSFTVCWCWLNFNIFQDKFFWIKKESVWCTWLFSVFLFSLWIQCSCSCTWRLHQLLLLLLLFVVNERHTFHIFLGRIREKNQWIFCVIHRRFVRTPCTYPSYRYITVMDVAIQCVERYEWKCVLHTPILWYWQAWRMRVYSLIKMSQRLIFPGKMGQFIEKLM